MIPNKEQFKALDSIEVWATVTRGMWRWRGKQLCPQYYDTDQSLDGVLSPTVIFTSDEKRTEYISTKAVDRDLRSGPGRLLPTAVAFHGSAVWL